LDSAQATIAQLVADTQSAQYSNVHESGALHSPRRTTQPKPAGAQAQTTNVVSVPRAESVSDATSATFLVSNDMATDGMRPGSIGPPRSSSPNRRNGGCVVAHSSPGTMKYMASSGTLPFTAAAAFAQVPTIAPTIADLADTVGSMPPVLSRGISFPMPSSPNGSAWETYQAAATARTPRTDSPLRPSTPGRVSPSTSSPIKIAPWAGGPSRSGGSPQILALGAGPQLATSFDGSTVAASDEFFPPRGTITNLVFAMIDTDCDGVISKQEFRDALRRNVVEPGPSSGSPSKPSEASTAGTTTSALHACCR